MSQTKTKEHQWMEMKVTPVVLFSDEDGNPVPVAIPDQEPGVQVGCFVCNMGMSEGFGVDCPGHDLFDDREEEP